MNGFSLVPLRTVTIDAQTGPFGSQLHSDDYVYDGIPVINPSNIISGRITSDPAISVTEATSKRLSHHRLEPGDLVFARRGELGRAAVTHDKAAGWLCGTGSLRVRTQESALDSRFAGHILQSAITRSYFEMYAVGSTMANLNTSIVLRLPIPLPQLDEQRRIANFLDAETARIDAVSNARKAQLAILDSRRKIQIRDAVAGSISTRKDGQSLTWLGPINNSWPTVLLGAISRTYMGTTFPHEYQGISDGDFPFIKVADFAGADANLTLKGARNWITKEVAGRLGAKIIPPNSILYARVGAAMLLNQRRIALRECIVDDNVRALSFTYGNPRYWLYLLTCLDLKELANPGPVPSVGEGQVAAVRLPFPTVQEQDKIVSELDSQAVNINSLKSLVSRQLQTLSERRQALITAAVTGAITV